MYVCMYIYMYDFIQSLIHMIDTLYACASEYNLQKWVMLQEVNQVIIIIETYVNVNIDAVKTAK